MRSRRQLFNRYPEYALGDDHRMYDITTDDQRFVMIRYVPTEGADLILVENFFEELKARWGTNDRRWRLAIWDW